MEKKYEAGISDELFQNYGEVGMHVKHGRYHGVQARAASSLELDPLQELAVEVIDSAYRELVFRMEAVNAMRCGEDEYGLYQLFPATSYSYLATIKDYRECHAKGTNIYRWTSTNKPWDEGWLLTNIDSPLTFFKSPKGVPYTFDYWFKFLYDGSTDTDGTLFIEKALEEAEAWTKHRFSNTKRIL